MVYIYTKSIFMTRQSISLTQPNDEWLKKQIENQEYSSKSELVNALIRKERKREAQIEWLKNKLAEAEKSGFSSYSCEEFIKDAETRING